MSSSAMLQYKLVLLGDSGVGKSSLLHRFVTNSFDYDSSPTIGASFMSKVVGIGEHQLKFNIWDTAGQERYRALTKMYYRDATVALLVFDLSNPESFRTLESWRLEIAEHGPKGICLAVAANKEDLAVGSDTEAVNWAKKHDAIYKRTSAKTSSGVEQLFVEIGRTLTIDKATSVKLRTSAVYLRHPHPSKAPSNHCCAGKTKKSLANT